MSLNLLNTLRIYIRYNQKIEEHETEILKKMNFAAHVLSCPLVHVRRGVHAVAGERSSMKTRIHHILLKIDQMIQKIVIRKPDFVEMQMLAAIAHLQDNTLMIEKLKDRAPEIQVFTAENAYDIVQKHIDHVNLKRIFHLDGGIVGLRQLFHRGYKVRELSTNLTINETIRALESTHEIEPHREDITLNNRRYV